MYRASDVAKYILWRNTADGTPASNLRLQKLLYFAWVVYYKNFRKRLFEDAICAWKFGPVVPSVYYEYCQYAGLPIRVYEKPSYADDLIILDKLMAKYFKQTTSDLVKETHAPGKPWDIVFNNGSGNRQIIAFSLIEDIESRCLN
ncbi:DUF4065 domain-containing protein [bacterium]|nr:DUF4065 domain-containing protein [bacterium]